MKITDRQLLIVLGALAALGYFAYRTGKRAVNETLNAVNPVSDDNLAYRGVNAIGGVLTQDEEFNLGRWLWEITNPEAAERLRAARAGTDQVGTGVLLQ